MVRLVRLLTALLLLGLVSSATQSNPNAVTPGEFIVEPPTLMNLGFEWKIQGDDNRNATIAVQYRKKGQSEWKEALPLLRVGDEKVWRAREYLEYWTPRLFAGSVLDLQEETAYECRFTMSDPDGVQGQAVQQVTVATRGVPKMPKGGRTLHVYPPDYQGPKEQPAFSGLKKPTMVPDSATGTWSMSALCNRETSSWSMRVCIRPIAWTM
jgi:hypothetical protein